MFGNSRGRIAALALVALVALSAIGLATAATVSSQSVTLQDPSNETVEVDVDFASSASATVDLVNASGSTVASTTISGNASETKTATVVPGSVAAGDYTLNLTSTDAANVTRNDTRLVATRDVEITNTSEETLVVDVSFNSSSNATADLTVTNSSGSTVLTDSISYVASDYADNATTITREYNASADGLVADNLTAAVTVSSASAFESTYAQASTDSTSGGGLLSGDIAGQDPAVAIGAGLVLVGGLYYSREEGWI